ncbi:hypothetical protein BT67DRAFT_231976 [Trichocladium antarcticum]|uniref:Uncharacterized protein n=1 Tax=Trichocladium antarcticum TaxID=1450529 RepID=A0AAN6UNG3_9PEZI|nr:hypothetical protein BT67DRAFT_231976 [Trichocladium antarcticum]
MHPLFDADPGVQVMLVVSGEAGLGLGRFIRGRVLGLSFGPPTIDPGGWASISKPLFSLFTPFCAVTVSAYCAAPRNQHTVACYPLTTAEVLVAKCNQS